MFFSLSRSVWRRAGFGDDGFIKKEVILNLFQDLPLGSFAFCIVAVVILESCSPGSVVTLKEDNNRYRNAPHRQTFRYGLLDNNP